MTLPENHRGGPGSMVGVAVYDVDSINVLLLLSRLGRREHAGDASRFAPVTSRIVMWRWTLPMVMRCFGHDTLDGFIEALIEHRTYVFGRRQFHSDYSEQRGET
jgi:hypothetical protein